jgi:hypothetical protein
VVHDETPGAQSQHVGGKRIQSIIGAIRLQ